MTNKLKEFERMFKSLLPISEWENEGSIQWNGAGAFDFEYDMGGLHFAFRTWEEFNIYKLRVYIDFILWEVGGYLSAYISAYGGDLPPGCRGGGRKSFDFIDVFITIV